MWSLPCPHPPQGLITPTLCLGSRPTYSSAQRISDWGVGGSSVACISFGKSPFSPGLPVALPETNVSGAGHLPGTMALWGQP